MNNTTKEPVTIIKHPEPQPVHTIGDICVPKNFEKHFRKATRDYYYGSRVFPLHYRHQNTWKALKAFDIEIEPLYSNITYKGAYSDNIYYYVMPIYIFTKDPQKYSDQVRTCWKEVWSQDEWLDGQRPCYEERFFTNQIQDTLLGHCYSYTHLPQDGMAERHDAVMMLSNGEEVGVKIWVWFAN